LITKLKALARWPETLHSEAHAIMDRIDSLAQVIQRALNRLAEPPPHFVLVLLQGQRADGMPFVGAMSGRMYNGKQMQLNYRPQRPVKNVSVMIFCDLEQVRIESVMAGNIILTIGMQEDSGAPLVFVESLPPSSQLRVALGAR